MFELFEMELFLTLKLYVVVPERVTNENTNTDIRQQIILH